LCLALSSLLRGNTKGIFGRAQFLVSSEEGRPFDVVGIRMGLGDNIGGFAFLASKIEEAAVA
jgi:hypothetical protein